MSGITKGPWVARKWSEQEAQIVARKNGKDFLVTGYALNPDARAISAVPEMIEALQGLRIVMDTAESNASGNPEWGDISSRVNAARAALAKALGDAS